MRTLRTAEAARAIGVAASTLQKWAQQGRVPFDTTAGGHRRFDIAELQAVLDRAEPAPDLDTVRSRAGQIHKIARRHGLTNLRVFGSVARGTASAGSDVDLLADADPGTSLLDVMAAEIELEAVLEAPVQIITTGDRAPLGSAYADAVAL